MTVRTTQQVRDSIVYIHAEADERSELEEFIKNFHREYGWGYDSRGGPIIAEGGKFRCDLRRWTSCD